MIRVLHIFHEMANGGIEHFVMDYYRHINRNQVQFDFLVSVEEDGYFDEEISRLGGRVFHAYPFKKNPIKNYYDIARIVRENGYQIVHRHTGSAFGYFDLRAARHGGAKHLILHSHNNQAGNKVVHLISNILLRIPCEKLACSQEAGKWLFGEKTDFHIINNAIDVQSFVFDSNTREKVRSTFNISDKFVIGHVGRFEEQKNHSFLLKIFASILCEDKECVLILVGTGSLKNEIVSEAKKLGIYENIIFLGSQKNVEQYYQAFDVFVLPSKYEGFGITLLEAQTNGLYCFTSSEVVPDSVNITGRVQYMSLKEEPEIWAKEILKKNGRVDIDISAIQMAGFDIETNAEKMCSYYKNMIDNRGESNGFCYYGGV